MVYFNHVHILCIVINNLRTLTFIFMIYKYIGWVYAVLVLLFCISVLPGIFMIGTSSHTKESTAYYTFVAMLMIPVLFLNSLIIFSGASRLVKAGFTGAGILIFAWMALYLPEDIFQITLYLSGVRGDSVIPGAVFPTTMMIMAIVYLIVLRKE